MTFETVSVHVSNQELTLDRPPREDYVRVTLERDGFTMEPAVEYRDGDDFEELAAALEWAAVTNIWPGDSQMKSAKNVAKAIVARWPDRAYFVEVWQHGKRGFAQCVQPFGFPRNR